MTFVVIGVAIRPWMWPTALRQVFILAASGWWRCRPFLPLPSRPYIRFRLETAYGDADAVPSCRDILGYLRWSRGMRKIAKRGAWPDTGAEP